MYCSLHLLKALYKNLFYDVFNKSRKLKNSSSNTEGLHHSFIILYPACKALSEAISKVNILQFKLNPPFWQFETKWILNKLTSRIVQRWFSMFLSDKYVLSRLIKNIELQEEVQESNAFPERMMTFIILSLALWYWWLVLYVSIFNTGVTLLSCG